MENLQTHIAPSGKRLVAYMIDILPIILIVGSIFYFFLGFDTIFDRYISRGNDQQPRVDFLKQRNMIRELSFLVWMIYCIFMEASSKQGSFGKQLMGIKVVNQYGMPLSFNQSVGRNLSKTLSYFAFGLGLIWILFDKKKQGWHDKLNTTYVVNNTFERFNLHTFEEKEN
jgi:uncharacterized RDD family membrane protein YckC